jgi:hypothetical protein
MGSRAIWITELFFENKLHWQFEVRLLLFTVGLRTSVWTLPPRRTWSSKRYSTVLYLTDNRQFHGKLIL